ncbi:ABC transporter permease [Micromonospora sp. CA-248089]|uniref:ABC transporter permease n=1 Tax=Micromonospora sp. CA-248089 TaxID=3239960 RepID=UPI003D8E4B00
MSSLSYAVADSTTMLRRNLLHMRRNPSMTMLIIGTPVVFLLLFVYVFGETLGAGLSGGGGRREYLTYIAPAIILMSAAATAQAIAISVAMDMTEGIIARFRTMSITRASVLAGHVYGGVIQAVLAMTAVLAVALLIGLRPDASALHWLALLGLLGLIALALAWLSVAFGLVTKSVETASNLPMFLMLLPILSSGFVPVESIPAGIRWFAEYQPFTPFINSVRGLLAGTPNTADVWASVAWSVAIAVVGYAWSRSLYRRKSVR